MPTVRLLVLAVTVSSLAGCKAPEAGEPAHALSGKPAPDFTLTALDGQSLHLAALKGKPVVLDFWATWCPPCRKLLPSIQKLHDEMGDKVAVIGVNDEDRATVQRFVADNHVTVPQALDTDHAVSAAYGVQGIPFTVFIDKDGNIAAVHEGIDLDHDLYADLKAEVDKLL
jgi:peroxiredoxin